MSANGPIITPEAVAAAAVLAAAAAAPVKALRFFVVPEVQLVLGSLVVIYIIMRDAASGLLLGLALLVAYMRVYAARFGLSWGALLAGQRAGRDYPMGSLVSDYITPEHLASAQSNVVSERDYKVELKGIEGVYGEAVYGAQGFGDKALPGFDKLPLGEEVKGI